VPRASTPIERVTGIRCGSKKMVQAVCSTCGAPWPDGQTRCACGNTSKTFQKEFKFELRPSFQVFKTVTRTVWAKNWFLIVIYGLWQVAVAVVSFWTSTCISVGWSVIGSLISTLLGLFIVVKVINSKDE
jgi:hypothetical protein